MGEVIVMEFFKYKLSNTPNSSFMSSRKKNSYESCALLLNSEDIYKKKKFLRFSNRLPF